MNKHQEQMRDAAAVGMSCLCGRVECDRCNGQPNLTGSIGFKKGYNAAITEAEILAEALEFYGDSKKWFMRDEVTNFQKTTAVFHVKDPSKLPTEFKSKSSQCTARLKIDQGKTAQEALARFRGEK